MMNLRYKKCYCTSSNFSRHKKSDFLLMRLCCYLAAWPLNCRWYCTSITIIFCNHVKSSWMLECFLDSIFDSLHSCKWYNMKSYQHDSLWCQYSSSDLCIWHVQLWVHSGHFGRDQLTSDPWDAQAIKSRYRQQAYTSSMHKLVICHAIDFKLLRVVDLSITYHPMQLFYEFGYPLLQKKIQSSMTWNFMKLASPKVSCCVSTTI